MKKAPDVRRESTGPTTKWVGRGRASGRSMICASLHASDVRGPHEGAFPPAICQARALAAHGVWSGAPGAAIRCGRASLQCGIDFSRAVYCALFGVGLDSMIAACAWGASGDEGTGMVWGPKVRPVRST